MFYQIPNIRIWSVFHTQNSIEHTFKACAIKTNHGVVQTQVEPPEFYCDISVQIRTEVFSGKILAYWYDILVY